MNPIPILPLTTPARPIVAAPRPLPQSGRPVLWLFGALLIGAAAYFGYSWMLAKPRVVYATATVERGDVESTVVAGGILQPIAYVDVGAQTSGKLKSLKVNRGDVVKKGQLLAEIDPILADTLLTSARAALDNMTSLRTAKQAQLALSKVQEERNDRLFATHLISANDRDITHAGFASASAEVDSLTAQIKQAKAAVDNAAANVGYAKITAPMAGDVVSVTALEGQTLNANQQAPTILRIADLNTITVWAQVSEADIHRVKPGQEVYFTVLGRNKRWEGKIRQILQTPELINSVVFYDVLFDIPNPKRQLGIQMTAQVFIVLARAKNALLIPAAVAGTGAKGGKVEVSVLKADGTVEPRTIQIGIRSEISAEVLSGLAEKEQVVLGAGAAKSSGSPSSRSPLSGRRGP